LSVQRITRFLAIVVSGLRVDGAAKSTAAADDTAATAWRLRPRRCHQWRGQQHAVFAPAPSQPTAFTFQFPGHARGTPSSAQLADEGRVQRRRVAL
jgi:hypothetical protein